MLKAVLPVAAVSLMISSAAWALPAPRGEAGFNSSDVVLVGKKHYGKNYGKRHYGQYRKGYGSHRYGYYGRRHHYGYWPYRYGYYGGYPYWRHPGGVSLFFGF